MTRNILDVLGLMLIDDDIEMLGQDQHTQTEDLRSLARMQEILADPTQPYLMVSDGDRAAARVRAAMLWHAVGESMRLYDYITKIWP